MDLSVLSATLNILGSLGVFLFGMKVMSEGIQKVAGNRLRAILSYMTQNRFAGVLTGFITTCLVQSSSATTVMVVSFVNAGLLTLVQSIGIIMGANQTVTVDGEQITYSKISRFYYENKPLDVCENVKNTRGDFLEGKYTVNVFNGNELLSTTEFVLD